MLSFIFLYIIRVFSFTNAGGGEEDFAVRYGSEIGIVSEECESYFFSLIHSFGSPYFSITFFEASAFFTKKG